jgi:inositol phosphorylceramide mannosyltransferase catalytic subunit
MARDSNFHLPEFSRSEGIPKIIHQNFFPGWRNVPEHLKLLTRDLLDRNPGWELQFVDAERADTFIEANYGSEVLQAFHSIDPAYYAARSDLLRYLLLYADGGVYFDIKSTGSRPLNEVLLADEQFILSFWPQESGYLGGGWSAGKWKELQHIPRGAYMQWFIVSARGHPYLRAVIERILARIANYSVFRDRVGRSGVLRLTGPVAFTLAIDSIREAHPHRIVEAERDLGFLYQVKGPSALKDRSAGVKRHYSTYSIPIIKGRPMRRHLTALSVTAAKMVRNALK